ncbi:Transmembrane protein 182 [Acipenser ruthenus]|uniref:Transmembrane protein 182 n=1 Tax=Acipenser ruthenus TaxID=7906 RepID=A0A662YPT4_ACIRT|nr:Transmembrane protein 182 [Acipenser ruthenus]
MRSGLCNPDEFPKTGNAYPCVFFSAVVVMYVIWVQVLSTMTDYKQQQKTSLCPDFQINIRYGWSFMLAPVGIFFSFLAGMLFLLIGRTVQMHYN